MPVAETPATEFERLTRRHAIKLVPAVECSVEQAGLAVGKVVGYSSVKSASRMNGAIVIFLDDTDKVSKVVESGVVIGDTFTPVLPLVSPAKKVLISNAPPFIKNEALAKELSRFGQLVSPIKMMSLGCKSPQLKHVVCHRRQVYMVLKDTTSDLNLSCTFKIDNFPYMVFVTTEHMKCFGCGAEGHLVRSCPERKASASGGTPPPEAAVAAAEVASPPRESAGPAAPLDTVAAGSSAPEDPVPAGLSTQIDPVPAVTGVTEAPPISVPAPDKGDPPMSLSGNEKKKTKKEKNKATVDTVDMSEFDDEAMSDGDDDDEMMKLSQKRKLTELVKEKAKNRKRATSVESDFVLTQDDNDAPYSVALLKKFLEDTKGVRQTAIWEHFSDLRRFINSAKPLTRKFGEVLTDQEVYRLRKHIGKAREELNKGEIDV